MKLVDPLYFIDTDRLDIMCRYLYVKSKDYKKLYEDLILKQTRLAEPPDRYIPNQPTKNTMQDYVDSFDRLIESFKTEGYNQDYPIYYNPRRGISSGAHRIACALHFNHKVPMITSNDPPPKSRWDRKWFETHGFSEDTIIELEDTVRCLHQ